MDITEKEIGRNQEDHMRRWNDEVRKTVADETTAFQTWMKKRTQEK